MTTPSLPQTPGPAAVALVQRPRTSAHDLLREALQDGKPLRYEVLRALFDLLSMLGLSEDPQWRPENPAEDHDLLANQAAAWRGAAERYQALLGEVREHGATALANQVAHVRGEVR